MLEPEHHQHIHCGSNLPMDTGLDYIVLLEVLDLASSNM